MLNETWYKPGRGRLMGSSNKTYFFKNKPLFGLDIGGSSIKVMQLEDSKAAKKPKVIGYGAVKFDHQALADGVLAKPELIAEAVHNLFHGGLTGDITTRRVAMAIPAYRTFTRAISLPALKPKEITEAVELEAEQYIPLPPEDVYLDYSIIKATADATEVFAVAVPRTIVDSYLTLAKLLGLEVVAIETTLGGGARLFDQDQQTTGASVIIDFGSLSSDITIVDKNILVTGTVQGGGAVFNESIRKILNVTKTEAGIIKNRYGLGRSKKQTEIQQALEPTLSQIVREIRRMIRYYEERYGTERPITQIVTLGGGASLPGLAEYLTDKLRLPARHCDPSQYFSFGRLQPPAIADRPMYATAAGLALINPREVLSL